MIRLLCLLLVFSCAHKETTDSREEQFRVKSASVELPASYKRAQKLLLVMTPAEKLKILRSYMTLRELSLGQVDPTTAGGPLFQGIPRLGIPSIQLVSDTAQSTRETASVSQGRVLKLGSVNLIRNFEKEQVYGNFSQAERVGSLLGPGSSQKIGANTLESINLQDLDIFLIKSGSEEQGIQDYICAIHRKGDQDYICVEGHFEQTLQELGIKQTLAQALDEGNLSPSQVDTLVLRMLAAMYELKIIT